MVGVGGVPFATTGSHRELVTLVLIGALSPDISTIDLVLSNEPRATLGREPAFAGDEAARPSTWEQFDEMRVLFVEP